MVKNKSKNEVERGDVVWRDNKALVWTSLIFSSFFLILSTSFLISSKPINPIYRVFLLPIVLLSIFFLYSQIRKRTTFITTKGIRIGNLVHWADDKIILKQKSTFFEWNDIKYINILKKSYRQGIYGGRDFYHIYLKTKSGKVYDCLVYNPYGFIQILKELNKYNLLSKDSRYK